jgi:hypothetical protein
LRENLAAVLIIPSSWGSQRAGHSTTRHQLFFWRNQPAIKLFSGAVAGEEVEDFCEGSFSHTHPLLCYCFALLYLFYLHRFLSKTQKKLESLIVVFTYLLLVLLK